MQNTFPSSRHDLAYYPEGFPASYGNSSGMTPYYHPRQLPNQEHFSYYANGTGTTVNNMPPSNGGIVLDRRTRMDSSQGAISSEFFPDGDSTSSFMRASNASSGCPPLLGGGSRMQHSFHPNTRSAYSAASPNNVEGNRGTIGSKPTFFFGNPCVE